MIVAALSTQVAMAGWKCGPTRIYDGLGLTSVEVEGNAARINMKVDFADSVTQTFRNLAVTQLRATIAVSGRQFKLQIERDKNRYGFHSAKVTAMLLGRSENVIRADLSCSKN